MLKKIVILSFTFPPNADGVAEATRAMAWGLAEKGHDVSVGTGYLPDRTDFSPRPNLKVHQFRIEAGGNFWPKITGEASRFTAFLLNANADFVICHCWETWPTLLAERVFSQLGGRKILVSHGYTTHLWTPTTRPPWGLAAWVRRLPRVLRLIQNLFRYDAVVVLSKKRDLRRFLDHLVGRALQPQRIHIIPNGTDIEAFCKRPDNIGCLVKDDEKAILFVANYSPRKNQELALRAFRRMDQAGTALIFIGSEFNQYSRNIQRLDGELRTRQSKGRVIFLERVPRASVVAAYLDCEIVLLTAKAETQPIVLIEAMAAGKPFISTNTGCVGEMPGGVTANNEEEIAEELTRLLVHPDIARNIGLAGQKASREIYDWKKIVARYEELLDSFPGKP